MSEPGGTCPCCGQPIPSTATRRPPEEPIAAGPPVDERFGPPLAPVTWPPSGEADRSAPGAQPWPNQAFDPAAQAQAKKTVVGCLVTAVVIVVAAVALIGGCTALLSSSTGGADEGLDPTSDLVVPVPGAAGSWIVQAPTSSAVMRVDAGSKDAAWESEPQEDSGLDQQVAVDEGRVYLSDGRQVMALDLDDGDQQWSVTLPDEVEPRAPECLACFDLVGDRLLVQTIDGEVHGLGVADGQEIWRHRYIDPSGRAVLVEDSLVVVDRRDEDQPGVELRVIDPSDGREISRAVPTCESPSSSAGTSYLTTAATLLPVEGEGAVVTVVGESPSCRQRIDLTSGAIVWSEPNDGGDAFASTGLVQADGIAYVRYAGIDRIDLATGELTHLLDTEDSESVEPAGMVGDVLMVTSTVNRGSTKSRLVGVDPRSGERLWTHDLDLSRPYDSESTGTTVSEGSPTWLLAEASDGGVRLITFVEEGDSGDLQPMVETLELDPRTGKASPKRTRQLEIDAPYSFTFRLLERRDDELVLNLDGSLQVLDVRTGEVTARWP